jgi:hypothetical protein
MTGLTPAELPKAAKAELHELLNELRKCANAADHAIEFGMVMTARRCVEDIAAEAAVILMQLNQPPREGVRLTIRR